MTRFVFLSLLLALALYGYTKFFESDATVVYTGNSVVRDSGELQIEFTPGRSFSEVYMIFGGDISRRLPNSFNDVTLAALVIDDAAQISRRYPDFHRCSSPGAALAQGSIETLSLMAELEKVAATIEESLVLHTERLSTQAERTCIKLEGNDLSLASVSVKELGLDISSDVIPKFRHTSFAFIESAAIVDCRSHL